MKDLPLDVRVIAASNRDLRTESEAGRFRLDLYYRLSVIQIDVPPLRDRGEDVVLLAQHLIEGYNQQFRKRVRGLTPKVIEIFRRYRWPGNVRELRNVIERVMILEDQDVITPRYLPRGFPAEGKPSDIPGEDVSGSSRPGGDKMSARFHLPPDGISLDDVEMSLVQQAMERSSGNQTKAAGLLRISRDQLRYRLKKLEEAQTSDVAGES